MSVLGAVFVDNEAIDTAHGILRADDFYRPIHRVIFESMTALAERSEPVDLVTMTNELKRRGRLEEIGGGAFLAVLVDYVPMSANIAHYCRIVAEKAQERRLILHAKEAIELAHKGGELEAAVQKLEHAIQPTLNDQSNAPVAMVQCVREAVERIQVRHENKGKIQGLPYGLADLDAATSGMHPGELIIVAGRPSMGKSAFAGNIIGHACSSGKSGLFFTLEMTRTDIVDRLAAAHRIKYQNIRSGMLEEIEFLRLHKVLGQIAQWDMAIDDTAAISLRDLRAKARRKKKTGLDILVVDYLQLMSMSDPKANRVQGIGEISRGLKALAKELNIPVVALSQLSRSVDSRNDKRPLMSDLRDSGEIEQDADVILFPYRPAAYCEKCKDKVDDGEHDWKEHNAKAEIIIEKQRAGERNLSIPAVWLGEHQRFEAVSRYGDLPE